MEVKPTRDIALTVATGAKPTRHRAPITATGAKPTRHRTTMAATGIRKMAPAIPRAVHVILGYFL